MTAFIVIDACHGRHRLHPAISASATPYQAYHYSYNSLATSRDVRSLASNEFCSWCHRQRMHPEYIKIKSASSFKLKRKMQPGYAHLGHALPHPCGAHTFDALVCLRDVTKMGRGSASISNHVTMRSADIWQHSANASRTVHVWQQHSGTSSVFPQARWYEKLSIACEKGST